jgi:hypothetical protein
LDHFDVGRWDNYKIPGLLDNYLNSIIAKGLGGVNLFSIANRAIFCAHDAARRLTPHAAGVRAYERSTSVCPKFFGD